MRNPSREILIGVGIALLLAGGATSSHASAQTASTQDAPPPAEALPPPSMDDSGMAPAPAKPAQPAKKKAAAAPPVLPAESAPVELAHINASSSSQPVAGQLTSTDPTPPKPSLTHSAPNSPKPAAADTRLTGDRMTVSVRVMDNGDRIEEYRTGGQLTRVKVTPRKAPPYEIIDTNGNGRVDDHDKNAQKTVGWTLFKWH